MDPLRTAYRLLLALHPRVFRREFSDEMLWVFDEVRSEDRTGRLLVDCLWSLLRQHVQAEDLVESHAGAFGLEINNSYLAALPLLRAGVLASLIIFTFMTELGRFHPLDYPTNSLLSRRVYRPTCEDFQPRKIGDQSVAIKIRHAKHPIDHDF
jgi:hypothetical protein